MKLFKLFLATHSVIFCLNASANQGELNDYLDCAGKLSSIVIHERNFAGIYTSAIDHGGGSFSLKFESRSIFFTTDTTRENAKTFPQQLNIVIDNAGYAVDLPATYNSQFDEKTNTEVRVYTFLASIPSRSAPIMLKYMFSAGRSAWWHAVHPGYLQAWTNIDVYKRHESPIDEATLETKVAREVSREIFKGPISQRMLGNFRVAEFTAYSPTFEREEDGWWGDRKPDPAMDEQNCRKGLARLADSYKSIKNDYEACSFPETTEFLSEQSVYLELEAREAYEKSLENCSKDGMPASPYPSFNEAVSK